MLTTTRNRSEAVGALLPIVAVLGALALFGVVVWTQFVSPVGTYRRDIIVSIPADMTDQLISSPAMLTLHSDGGETAEVRAWSVSTGDDLTLKGFRGRRRDITYTELVATRADGRRDRASVNVAL